MQEEPINLDNHEPLQDFIMHMVNDEGQMTVQTISMRCPATTIEVEETLYCLFEKGALHEPSLNVILAA